MHPATPKLAAGVFDALESDGTAQASGCAMPSDADRAELGRQFLSPCVNAILDSARSPRLLLHVSAAYVVFAATNFGDRSRCNRP